MLGPADLGRLDEVMADVLSCGPRAAASHLCAAGVLGIRPLPPLVEVSVPAEVRTRPPGVRVHRRRHLPPEDVGHYRGIPVTSPIRTLIDIATEVGRDSLEAAINMALDGRPKQPGVAALRRTLDRRTFTMTDTELERRFLPISRRSGLPQPLTQRWVNGFRVDFYWPELELVVETDGLRYHRTPAEQAVDRVRDQTHSAAGLTPLRFTLAQVRYEPSYVQGVLEQVARRLRR
jgi:very-short-patch-repair endonuclease